MAAKLLHSLTDDNPDLQKQIGCMTGIFQLFDRQPIFTSGGGSREVAHAPSRPPHNGNSHLRSSERESNNTHPRSASREKYSHESIREKQRISAESSRPSFSSSSRSSSFSSLDCNRATHFEPASYDRITFPETPSRDPTMSLDIRGFVKESMYRDSKKPPQNESHKALAKLQEASPWYLNEPRELLRSASYHSKEGSSFSGSRDIAPRFSYDSRDVSRSNPVKLKDSPRLSLDSRESSIRPPSVVAKLMGLETLPDSIPSSGETNSVSSQSYRFEDSVNKSANTDGKSVRKSNLSSKEPRSPRWRNSEPTVKPVLRIPIEPAPWKHIDSAKGSQKPAVRTKASKNFPSVYSEIENRLKDLEFTQSGKDLRALKQILETMQSKGFLETKNETRVSIEQQRSTPINQKPWSGSSRHYDSPIVIMKPANRLVEKSSLPAVSRLAKDGPNNKSESISPRMHQKKLELEKRSRPPTSPDPSKSRRQPNKQQSESNSPGGRRRPKQTSEVYSESRSTDLSSCRSLSPKASKKSTHGTSEEESSELGFVRPEHSSPVSVLDKVVCKEDSPSPVKYVSKTLRADVSLDKERDSTESGISRKKLQKIESLVQKLTRLNSTHDESSTDYIASLCENTHPDHRYISEILLASGLLLRELGSSLANFQFHPSGHPINPELFLVLEQTKSNDLREGKLHRKLVFDAVNEILARKLTSPGKRSMNAHMLLKDLCSEIELIRAKDLKCGPDDQEEEEGWKEILCEDVVHQSDSWKTFYDEVSGAVLDIERSIFKDLVDEVVIGESCVGGKTRQGRRRRLFDSL